MHAITTMHTVNWDVTDICPAEAKTKATSAEDCAVSTQFGPFSVPTFNTKREPKQSFNHPPPTVHASNLCKSTVIE